jgi:hypothetical protein
VGIQKIIDDWLIEGLHAPCRVVRESGDRVFIDTALDGHNLLKLERHLKRQTGRYIELLCEEKRDANVLRRMADLRGKRTKEG